MTRWNFISRTIRSCRYSSKYVKPIIFETHVGSDGHVQENYLKTQPAKLRNLEGPEKSLKELELMDRAASSISDGDLVDALIHGSALMIASFCVPTT